jgi:hypothetical protein
VSVTTATGFTFSNPVTVLRSGVNGIPDGGPANPATYDITPDGKHFLGVVAVGETTSAQQIQIVLNWFEELKARVPAGK